MKPISQYFQKFNKPLRREPKRQHRTRQNEIAANQWCRCCHSQRGETRCYRGTSNVLGAPFSSQAVWARIQGSNGFKVIIENTCQLWCSLRDNVIERWKQNQPFSACNLTELIILRLSAQVTVRTPLGQKERVTDRNMNLCRVIVSIRYQNNIDKYKIL